MKKLALAIALVLVLLFASCSKASGINESPTEIFCEANQNFLVEKISSRTVNVKAPAGMCQFNNQLVIIDAGSHCLTVLDLQLNYIKSIGTLGSAPGEFLEPTGITVFNDQLYVLDAGNSRIQVLDKDFKVTQEIALDVLAHHQGGFRYLDIAVDKDGIIYVSTNSAGKVDAYIYAIIDNEIHKLKQPFIGYFSQYDGDVYAMDTYETYRNGATEGAASGAGSLYRLTGKKMQQVAQLPNKFTPSDFIILDDKIYVISSLWGKLYELSMDAIVESEVAKFEKSSAEMYIAAIDDIGFIVANTSSKEIYKIYLQNS